MNVPDTQWTEQNQELESSGDDPTTSRMSVTDKIHEVNNGTFLSGRYLIKDLDIAHRIGRSISSCQKLVCLWPKSLDGFVYVPYSISRDFSYYGVSVITSSLDDIQDATCIRFINRTSQIDYINFLPTSGCWALVGRTGGGQTVSLENPACLWSAIVTHEVFHTLGLHHEHVRRDRDNYVQVQWDNIQQDGKSNFEMVATYNENLTAYDYGSIMHYSKTAYSVDGIKPTLIAVPDSTVKFGQGYFMTDLDAKKINRLYNCSTLTKTTTPKTTTTTSPGTTTRSTTTTTPRTTTRSTTTTTPRITTRSTTTTTPRTTTRSTTTTTPRTTTRSTTTTTPRITTRSTTTTTPRTTTRSTTTTTPRITTRSTMTTTPRTTTRSTTITTPRTTTRSTTSTTPKITTRSTTTTTPRITTRSTTTTTPRTTTRSTTITTPRTTTRSTTTTTPRTTTRSTTTTTPRITTRSTTTTTPRTTTRSTTITTPRTTTRSTTTTTPRTSIGKTTTSTTANKTTTKVNPVVIVSHGKTILQDFCMAMVYTWPIVAIINTCFVFFLGCGGNLTNSEGVITSPNFPDSYPNNAYCHWNITMNTKFKITFTSFDIESGGLTCLFDKLKIYNGRDFNSLYQYGDLCGQNLPTPITSYGNTMQLIFNSDWIVGHKGFSLIYKAVECNITELINFPFYKEHAAEDSQRASNSHPKRLAWYGDCTVIIFQIIFI
ncbi:uncharacterized protein LOC142098482 [Mixophyes fleayi]|uniref:uncharacterized protein LOC142098482 n=1 Tax=Mixophyes fleayi TaxID=3061075 RepID=UPI003F4E149C